jgi:hypothetical protein
MKDEKKGWMDVFERVFVPSQHPCLSQGGLSFPHEHPWPSNPLGDDSLSWEGKDLRDATVRSICSSTFIFFPPSVHVCVWASQARALRESM